jgi:hypothetical protein
MVKDKDGRRVAVFKPRSEEQFMPANPHGLVGARGTKLRTGLPSGDNWLKEVAA